MKTAKKNKPGSLESRKAVSHLHSFCGVSIL